jgi:hypothetical protein
MVETMNPPTPKIITSIKLSLNSLKKKWFIHEPDGALTLDFHRSCRSLRLKFFESFEFHPET